MPNEGTSSYPSAQDDFNVPSDAENTALGSSGDADRDHPTLLADMGAAVEAVQGELGLTPSGSSATVVARLDGHEGGTVGQHGHGDLTGVTSDQHHAQSHAHDGVDGSGTVAHADTTGQGTDDHHAQDHASRHSPGGADDISGSYIPKGEDRQFTGLWVQDDVAASQTDVDLNLYDGTSRSKRVMVRAGSVTGIVVRSNEARSGGTLTVEVTVNGTGTGLTAVLDSTNTTVKATTQAVGTDTFAAGDEVGVALTTDGSWTPTTADISVEVEVVT